MEQRASGAMISPSEALRLGVGAVVDMELENARLKKANAELLDFAKAVAAAGQSGADTVNFLVELRDLAIRASKLVARATGGQP